MTPRLAERRGFLGNPYDPIMKRVSKALQDTKKLPHGFMHQNAVHSLEAALGYLKQAHDQLAQPE